MSPSWACTWMSLPDRCTFASMRWSSFSTVITTFTSITWSKCRLIRSSLETTYSRIAGVMSTWWPVRCRFIDGSLSDRLAEIRGLDVHRFSVLRYGAACNLDALLGEDVGDAVVGE